MEYNYAQVRDFIEERIKHITLFFTPCYPNDNMFASTGNNGILININHIRKGLSIEEFQKGPLRPYLLLCIYHELSHDIIREFCKKKVPKFE